MRKIKRLKFAVLLVTFATVAVGAQETQDWSYYYKEALNKRNRGDYIGSLADLDVAVKLAPDKPELYNARGVAYEKIGDYAAAMANYEFALAFSPNSAETLHNITALNNRIEGTGGSSTWDFGRDEYGWYEGDSGYEANEGYESYGDTPSVQGDTYGSYEGYGEYGTYDGTSPVQGDTYGSYEGYGEYGTYGGTSSVQGDTYGSYEGYGEYGTYGGYEGYGEYGTYGGTSIVQGNPYGNAGYGSYNVLPPVQSNPYSRRGVVSFFPEQSANEGSVPAAQPVAPISKQDVRQNSDVTSGKVTANGMHDKTIVIQQGGTAQGAFNSPFYNPPAAGSVMIKVIVNGSASIMLNDGRVSQQEPLNVTKNMAERSIKTTVPNTPVQHIQSVQKVSVDPVAEIYNNYGVALYKHGLYNEAVLQFNEAIKLCQNYAIAYNNRGLAFIGKGDFGSAATDFDQALRINPYYHDAQFNRSTITNSIAWR